MGDTLELEEKMLAKEILVDLLFVMMVVRLSLQALSAGVMDVHWLITQESTHVQLISWTGSKLKWEVTEQHPHQLQQHPHQLDVDLHNGLKINGVMMKTIMPTATGMEALVVTILLEDGTHTAQHVNVKIQMLEPLPLLRLLA